MALSGGKGNSRADTSSSSTTVTETTNNVDNRVTVTDFGAVSAGADIAHEALDSLAAALRSNENVTRDALSVTGDTARLASNLSEATTRAGLDFGRDAIDTVTRLNSDSLELLGGLVGKTIDASRTLARDNADANSRTVADAITGFRQLAVQTSESTDDKIARVAGYAFAAIAAALVLPGIFKGGSKTVVQ